MFFFFLTLWRSVIAISSLIALKNDSNSNPEIVTWRATGRGWFFEDLFWTRGETSYCVQCPSMQLFLDKMTLMTENSPNSVLVFVFVRIIMWSTAAHILEAIDQFIP